MEVHEDAVGVFALVDFDGFVAVFCGHGLVAELAEEEGEELEVHFVVFDDEDAEGILEGEPLVEGLCGCGSREMRRECDFAERDVGDELRSLSRPAVDFEGAAHELGEAPGNGESQSCAAVAAGDAGVGLGEGFENVFDILWCNTGAGILDEEFVVRWLAAEAEAERDGAEVGEFQGIAREVEEDLPEAAGVAFEKWGNGFLDGEAEIELLVAGLGTEQGMNVMEDLAGLENLSLDRHASGFEAAEVEDVVEDAQECPSAGADGLRVVEGLRGQGGGLGEEFGEPENAAEGSADFVAHHGEEFAFGVVCGASFLGEFFLMGESFGEFLLTEALLGDVPVGADHSPGLARVVVQQIRNGADVADRSVVPADDAELRVEGFAAAVQCVVEFRLGASPVLGVKVFCPTLGEESLPSRDWP